MQCVVETFVRWIYLITQIILNNFALNNLLIIIIIEINVNNKPSNMEIPVIWEAKIKEDK